MNRSEDKPMTADHRKVDQATPDTVDAGEILVDQSGNVVIGAPAVAVAAEAPQPGGGD